MEIRLHYTASTGAAETVRLLVHLNLLLVATLHQFKARGGLKISGYGSSSVEEDSNPAHHLDLDPAEV